MNWPHKLVYAQWVALVRAKGYPDSVTEEHISLFVPEMSVYEAFKLMVKEVEPMKTDCKDLVKQLGMDSATRMLAFGPYRPE